MISTARRPSVGARQTPDGRPVGDACLAELRSRLARRCEDDDGGDSNGIGGDGTGDGGVRGAVDAAVGPLTGAGPLVDARAVRSVDDGDLVWCAQAVQRAINMLEGARSALATEVVRRRLHARRGEASGAETLVNATAVGGALARRIEREAQALGAQPPVAEVLGRGEINSDQAAVVAAADVPDDVRRDLCKQAKNQTADQTRRSVRAAEAAWRQRSDAQRRSRQRAARSASMWVDPHDGMWHLRAKLDALTGDAIDRLLLSAIERNWRSDKDLPESKRRSVAQRAADALAWLLASAGAQGAASAGGGAATLDGAQGSACAGGGAATLGGVQGSASGVGDAATLGGAQGSASGVGDAATPGDAQGSACAGGDAAAPGGARHTDSVPRDVAAAAGAPATKPAAGASGSESAAGDVGNVTGEGLKDSCWVVPSPTQMIVLTTLDNLRGGSPREGLDAECIGVASRPTIDLLAVPGAVATTETGTVLGAADLRRIACDTRVIPVVMGGASEVLDVGRATRTIPAAIRRALIARDQGCVWPGCDRAPIHCDGHHIQHWIDDGPTSLANLALLCHSHHHRLHEFNLVLHLPTGPAPPGEGWTVTPAPPCPPAQDSAPP